MTKNTGEIIQIVGVVVDVEFGRDANDNASDLVDDLTLAMNKARQGSITQELAEISGGVEAMK